MIETSYFTNHIKKGLESAIDDRDPTNISMSSIGHCARQLAYRMHGIDGTPLNWRARMIFDDGHMAHDQLRFMLNEALVNSKSCYKLVKEEADVDFSGVGGHIDGILEHSDECKDASHSSMLLEVKSMNDRAFAELKKNGELPWEYRCQVSGYLAATGMTKAIILAKNKNTGDLAEYIYEVERDLLETRMVVIDNLLDSGDPEQVARDYAPNNRGNLPWQCNYCPFVSLCWRDFELVEKKGRKFGINYKMFQAWNATLEVHDDKEVKTAT